MRISLSWTKWLSLGVTTLCLAVAGFALAGCSKAHELPNKLITFGFQTMDPQGGEGLTMPISGLHYRYIPSDTLTEVAVNDVQLQQTEYGLQLVLGFDTTGQKILYRETALHEGLLLFVFVSEGGAPEKPIGAMRITQPLGDGQLAVYVEIPQDKLESYVLELQTSVKKLQELKE